MASKKLGTVEQWRVEESLPTGYWLTSDSENSLFLPIDNVSRECETNETLDVFITLDQDGQIVADMRLPNVELSKPTVMVAKDAIAKGAFFAWGATRDLYVPEKWQESSINPGMRYVVVPLYDEKSKRILGCTKLKRVFPETNKWLTEGQTVSLTVFAKTQLGYKMLIDDATLGLLFHSDVHVKLNIGDTVQGTIKQVREDGKLDLALGASSKNTRKSLQDAILEDLEAHDGLSTLTDKSSPEDIYDRFQVSKGAYKKALGQLFKQRKIQIDNSVIRLTR